MERNERAFASITLLLFLVFFTSITLEEKNTTSDFIIIKQVETLKENTYLNFERTIENKLNNCKDDPFSVKLEVVDEIFKFTEKNSFFIENTITNERKEVSYLELLDIVKVIVYKPTKEVTVKEVHITQGILKNKKLGYSINSKKYTSSFLFPENYFIRKVVFC